MHCRFPFAALFPAVQRRESDRAGTEFQQGRQSSAVAVLPDAGSGSCGNFVLRSPATCYNGAYTFPPSHGGKQRRQGNPRNAVAPQVEQLANPKGAEVVPPPCPPPLGAALVPPDPPRKRFFGSVLCKRFLVN